MGEHGSAQGTEKSLPLEEPTAWWVVPGVDNSDLTQRDRFPGQPCLTYGLELGGMPVTLPRQIPICGRLLEGIPSVAVTAMWNACPWRVWSESNPRHLLSVKLIMPRSSECLGARDPVRSADFM